jgi:hypothetical protein
LRTELILIFYKNRFMTQNIIENESAILNKDVAELSEDEIRERIILLGFDGDERLFERFRQKLIDWLPPGNGASLRGSVVTNARHEDGTPFDSKGEKTSDLDLTLHGAESRAMYDEYYIPGLHSKPLGDKDPGIATPELDSFRRELQAMVGRPVNIHATADIVMYIRDFLGQPYFMIVEPEETENNSDAPTA